jgi:pimeloyl-ACP methyl ester carboxylesterase
MLRFSLKDGRHIAWRVSGKADGFPVFFAHGNLNSRLFLPAWDKTQEQTAAANARVISVDRPGYGGSNKHEGRTYSDFAADIIQLADHLELKKFGVVGYSSGGPHACAVAALAGVERCTVVGLISADAPYADPAVGLSLTRMYGASEVTLDYALEKAEDKAAEMREGYERMEKENRRIMALADLDAAVARGFHGAASDAVLESSQSWGFELESLRGSGASVLLWHGVDDEDVPLPAGQYLAEKTGGRLTELSGENHTLIRRHWQQILERVVEVGGR